MEIHKIPSTDNLLELAHYSLKLVESIRGYLPVIPEIVPLAPINDIDRLSVYMNLAHIAQLAANADNRAMCESRSQIGEHVVYGWPALEVESAWSHTSKALETILEHYDWSSLSGKDGIAITSESTKYYECGREVSAEDICPDTAILKLNQSTPPIPRRKLDTLEHFARILFHRVTAALPNQEQASASQSQENDTPPNPKNARQAARAVTLDEQALALFFADKSRTKSAIAELLHVQTQSLAPARCPQLTTAMKAWRSGNAGERPGGSKDRDGNIEAWDEDE